MRCISTVIIAVLLLTNVASAAPAMPYRGISAKFSRPFSTAPPILMSATIPVRLAMPSPGVKMYILESTPAATSGGTTAHAA